MQWKLVDEDTPKDRPILGLCNHEADTYYVSDSDYLTTYANHCIDLMHVSDGVHVLVWGGKYGDIPDWWFQSGSCFQTAANPVYWADITDIPVL